MNSVKIVIQAFYEICLLKKRPQDLPVSGVFFCLCAATYAISSLLLTLTYQDLRSSLLAAFMDAGLTILITCLILFVIRRPERILQTGTALLGTGTIFSLLAMPVYSLLALPVLAQSGSPVLSFLVWVLIIWNIAVMAHILRHALTVSYPMAVLLALVYVIVVSAAIVNVVPEQPV